MEMFKEFAGNEQGSTDALDNIVNVAIALILVSSIGVSAWQLLGNANYTGVDATVKTMVQTVIGIVAAIAVVLVMLRIAKEGR